MGCTNTRPFFTRTLNVGTFSTNGGGDAPVSGWYWYPCHGQVMQPKTILPSPNGPFWCWQTFETAEILPSYLKMATRSPDKHTMRARFSGISPTAHASTNSSVAGADTRRLRRFSSGLSVATSLSAAVTCRPSTITNPTATTATYTGFTSACSTPNATCNTSNP